MAARQRTKATPRQSSAKPPTVAPGSSDCRAHGHLPVGHPLDARD
jgi:hypothetical protein